MALLVAGLALFLGIHLVPAIPAVRARCVARLGEERYKGLFSLVSAIGLVLIIWGYAIAPRGEQVFAPSAAARQFAPYAVTLAFVLLAAANMRTHIRRALVHPMLLGIGIWAATHLLANGHLKATLLFGAFLVYALLDLGSAVARGARRQFVPLAKHDAIAVGAGILLALIVMGLHRWLFGIPVVGWGA
jgi:uncharacterized membrane protein